MYVYIYIYIHISGDAVAQVYWMSSVQIHCLTCQRRGRQTYLRVSETLLKPDESTAHTNRYGGT